MGFLLPALVALIPLLMTPGLLFHYDSLPKVALLALAMSVALMRPARVARDIAALRRSQTGKWLCTLAAVQIVWTAVATSTSSRVMFSLFGSNWRRFGFITVLALAIFAVLAAGHLIIRSKDVTPVLRAMAIAAIGVSLYAIAQYFNIDPLQSTAGYHAQDGDFTIVRPPGSLGHADYMGWWLAIAVFCSWGLSRIERHAWRWVALAATTLSAVATVLSGTRSAIAAIGFGILYLAFTTPLRPQRKHLFSAAAIAVAFFVFYQSPAGERLRARVRWSTDEVAGGGRPLLWRDALKMSASHPLTGFGPETFAAEFPRYQSVALARLVPDFYHESPHNAAFDALTSEGLPGLLLVIGWMAIGLYAIAQTRKKPAPLDGALAAAFVASVVASAFNSMTIGPAVATLTVLALLIARNAEMGRDAAPSSTVAHVSTGIAAAVVAPVAAVRVAVVPVAAVLAAFGVMLTVSDFKLERFSRRAAGHDAGLAVTAYRDLRRASFPGPAEDLYCSRRLASMCGAGGNAVARLECSQVATQAAAEATETADNPPNAWYNLAMFAAAHNDGRGTEKALRTAADIAPNWFRPHWALANYLMLSGRKAEASVEINRAALLGAGKIQQVTDSVRTIAQAR
jgi:O-antigen ligase